MALPATSDAFSTLWERAMAPLANAPGDNRGGDHGVDVQIEGGEALPEFDQSGALNIPTDDGGVVIQFPGAFNDEAGDEFGDHDANLALEISDSARGLIADDLSQAIEQDDRDRAQYLANRAKGIDLLALALEPPRTDASSSTGSMEGMSSIRNPLLLESVLRFQANVRGELLPANGPVKVKNDGQQSLATDAQAEALVNDMNTYLTSTAAEYYPDTDKLLFGVGFGGCGFKKVYHCPLRRRPVSESVDAKDLIVPNSATDLRTAPRITHVIAMPPGTLRRMQYLNVYRDVELGQPVPVSNAVKEKMAKVMGIAPSNTMRPQDLDHTLYETQCELDLPGFEDVGEDGYPTGLKLPYRVTLEKDSKEILAIRRDWAPDDEMKTKKRLYVKYPFVPSNLGFYDIGLLNILGNATVALTAAWRIALDNGMFSNFPGFVYSKQGVGRQLTNEFRVPPGGGVGIDTGTADIRQAVMALPYKDLSPAFAQFFESVQQTMQRVGSTAETNVGEGRQDAPVGTTLALIEQAKVILDAVHKRLYGAQAEEFQLLADLFREDPEAFWRHNKDPQFPQDKKLLREALENTQLVPVADPNVPSSMHRHAKIAALMQLVQAYPQLFDIPTVLLMVLRDMRFDNPQELLAKGPPPGPPPDPKLQIQQMKSTDAAQKVQSDAMVNAAERKSRENLALMRMATTQVIHPQSAELASNPVMPQGLNQ
jgi:hypothetical protein